MLITQALITGLITSVVLTVLVFVSLAYNSRLWIKSAPKAMQEASKPLTTREKRERIVWVVPIMLVMFAYPIYQGVVYESTQGAFTFLQAYLYFGIVWFTWNLWDLLIMDWLIVVWWNPPQIALPNEVAHLSHLNNYRFHFHGFLKGCLLVIVLSAIVATVFTIF